MIRENNLSGTGSEKKSTIFYDLEEKEEPFWHAFEIGITWCEINFFPNPLKFLHTYYLTNKTIATDLILTHTPIAKLFT